jgi:hypothetical protein
MCITHSEIDIIYDMPDISCALTSAAVRAFLRARAASSADLAAEFVISNRAASKFRMRSAAADSLLLLCPLFLVGDLEAMAVAAFADLVGDDRSVILVL